MFQQRRQVGHILRSDVARVGSGVHRDAGGTGLQAKFSGAHHTGEAQVAGVSDQGHFVQVHRQSGRGELVTLGLIGLLGHGFVVYQIQKTSQKQAEDK
jgi:hypothetical protein